MKTDTLKLIFTYLIAMSVVVGGGVTLFAVRADPTADDLRVLIGGFIGITLQFVYGAEVQKQTSKQAETTATAATTAAAAATNGHTLSRP
jgi:hypothetical protein